MKGSLFLYTFLIMWLKYEMEKKILREEKLCNSNLICNHVGTEVYNPSQFL